MQKNAIVPYILIMAFGIGLIFFLSLEGVNNEAEIAEDQPTEEGEKATEGEEGAADDAGGETTEGSFDPAAKAESTCVSCHGSSYEGQVGPSLVTTELSQEEIEEVIANGRGAMPGGLVEEENIPAMAEWVLSLE